MNRVDPDGHRDQEDCYNCEGGGWSGPENPLPPEEQWTVEDKLNEWYEEHPEFKPQSETPSDKGLEEAIEGEEPTMEDFEKYGDPLDKDFGEEKPGDRPYRNYDNESTGDTTPKNSTEANAMQQAQRDPSVGRELTNVKMGDSRWPSEAGWMKMAKVVDGVTIHYVYNPDTGESADWKFVR